MTEFARYTVEKFLRLDVDGAWCFNQVGGLEVATTPERLAELHRRQGWATSWGIDGRGASARTSASGCTRCSIATRVLGGLHVPDRRAGQGRPRGRGARPAGRGARRARSWARPGSPASSRRRPGDRRAHRRRACIPADIVVSCAGFWGPEIGAMVGMAVPLLPLAHQYAWTGQVPELAGRNDELAEASLPILRHQDQDLYFREHGDRLGIGSYAHRPMPVRAVAICAEAESPSRDAVDAAVHRARTSRPPGSRARRLLPALRAAKVDEGFNGIFSFTPDGIPLIGESADVAGLLDRRGGLGDALRRRRPGGGRAARRRPQRDRPARLRRAPVRADPARRRLRPRDRGSGTSSRSTTSCTRCSRGARPRDLRVSPFHARQQELGAVFLEAAGWERPHWYEANAPLAGRPAPEWIPPERDAWSARFWSPIAAAEAWRTRTAVALYDMTPLKRLEVTGPGALALLQRLTTGNAGQAARRRSPTPWCSTTPAASAAT